MLKSDIKARVCLLLLNNLQGRLAGLQQQLSAADRELQQLRNQMKTLEQQDKRAVGDRARAGHAVQQLQVRRGPCMLLVAP